MWRKKPFDRCWKHLHHGGHGTIHNVEKNLPKFYGRHLSGALKEAVQNQLAAPHSEQIELYEELALVREFAGECVALFNKSIEAGKDAGPAGSLMTEALKEVAAVADKIASIEAKSTDVLTVHTLNGAVSQITRIFYEVCGDDYRELAEVLEQRIRAEVQLPLAETKGTDIRPGDDVGAMNSTIPGPPPDDHGSIPDSEKGDN